MGSSVAAVFARDRKDLHTVAQGARTVKVIVLLALRSHFRKAAALPQAALLENVVLCDSSQLGRARQHFALARPPRVKTRVASLEVLLLATPPSELTPSELEMLREECCDQMWDQKDSATWRAH
jgi:hypothetical protein